jgi:hypothetical protein
MDEITEFKLTLENFLKSMDGKTVKYGEPDELIVRLARTVDSELDELYNRILEIERTLGL